VRLFLGILLILVFTGCEESSCMENPAPLGELTAWENSFYSENRAPDSPSAEYLNGEDGLGLAYRDWIPDEWIGEGDIVVLVPGSSSHSEQYSVLGRGISERGVYTRIIDVRGHGLSVCRSSSDCSLENFWPWEYRDDNDYYVGRIGDSFDSNQIIRDLGRHVATLKEEFPFANIYVAGHSSGGGVVSRFADAGGVNLADGLILLAPFNHYEQPQNREDNSNYCRSYANIDTGALGAAIRGDIHRYVLFFDHGDELTLSNNVTQYSYTTMTGMATEDPVKFWQSFTKPHLFIAAENDHLLDPEKSRKQFEKAAFPGDFTLIKNTSHIGLTISDEVAETIADWLENRALRSDISYK